MHRGAAGAIEFTMSGRNRHRPWFGKRRRDEREPFPWSTDMLFGVEMSEVRLSRLYGMRFDGTMQAVARAALILDGSDPA
jgi:hypothetical protein